MERFTVFEIVREAPRMVFGRFRAVILSALIPALAMTAVQLIGHSRLFEGIDFVWRRLIFGAGEWVVAAPFLAAWYRHFLDPSHPMPSIVYRVRRVDLPFIAYTIGFSVALLSSFVAANTLLGNLGPEAIRVRLPVSQTSGTADAVLRASMLEAAAMILVFVVYLRLIFVFPASAEGEPLGLAGSWSISRNHHLKIFWVLLFVVMLFALIGMFVMTLILSMVVGLLGNPGLGGGGIGNASLMLTLFLTNLFILFATTAQVAAVSRMYEALKGPAPAAGLGTPWGQGRVNGRDDG